jgi:lipopolysaccharide/colanic/teichoic acid biosynthesis glycosyltransferase
MKKLAETDLAMKTSWVPAVHSACDYILKARMRTLVDLGRLLPPRQNTVVYRKFFKRFLDIVLSVIGLVLAFPVMLIIAA